MDLFDGVDAHWLWLAAGLALAGLEMLVPGIYLIWLALAALTTGLIVFGVDQVPGLGMGVPLQIVSFVFLALIYAFSARRWLHDTPIVGSDPLLNHRGARMVGETALVTQTIEHGSGRVKHGDSEWIARGPDMTVGERVRICGTEGAVLLVEPLALPGAKDSGPG